MDVVIAFSLVAVITIAIVSIYYSIEVATGLDKNLSNAVKNSPEFKKLVYPKAVVPEEGEEVEDEEGGFWSAIVLWFNPKEKKI